ncbi:MAG: hypothetical protein GY856_33480 [bacterium]|nr:hypothetical protein [bacterium]
MTDQNQDEISPPRTATRAPVDRPVKLQFDDALEVTEAHCVNASIGGMLVLTDNLRPQGSLVRFELVIDEETSVRGLGEVIWTRAESAGRVAGMGVKFRFLEQHDRQLILRFVSQYIKERLAQKHPPATEAFDEPTPADLESIPGGDESITFEEIEEHLELRPEDRAEPAAWDEDEAVYEPVAQGAEPAAQGDEPEPAEKFPEPAEQYEEDGEYEEYEYEDEEEYPHRPAPRRDFPLLPVIALILVAAGALLYVFWDSLLPSSEPPTAAPGVEAGPPADGGTAGDGTTGEPGGAGGAGGAEPIAAAIDAGTPAPAAAQERSAPEATARETPSPPQPEPPPAAEPLPPPSVNFSRIVDITWVDELPRLKIVITADGSIPGDRYKHIRLGGENPREVIRFTDVRQRYPSTELPVGGPGVRQIRVGYHKKAGGNELHLVLDMLDQHSRVTEILNRGSKLEVIVEP